LFKWVGAASFVQVGHRNDRNAETACEFRNWLQDFSRFYVSVSVCAAHVGGYWINDDKTNVTDRHDFLFEQIQIGL
jgi:hypothetical protein